MDSGPLSFPALLAGALSRWRAAVAVAVGVVALALGLTLVIPPSYRAESSFVTTDASIELPRERVQQGATPHAGAGTAGVSRGACCRNPRRATRRRERSARVLRD